jgi:hypothetical protein
VFLACRSGSRVRLQGFRSFLFSLIFQPPVEPSFSCPDPRAESSWLLRACVVQARILFRSRFHCLSVIYSLAGIKFFLCVCIQRLCFIAARCSFCLPQGFTAQLPQFVVSRVANLIFFGSRVQEPRSSLPAPDFDAARFLWFVRSPGCSSPKASFFYRALWISIFAAESSFPAQYFRCSRS